MFFTIDFIAEEPIYLQIRNQVVLAIGNGELASGEGLPSVRDLAEELGINHMTVNKAYSLLKQEGFLVSDKHKGTRVRIKQEQEIPEEYYQRLSVVLSEGIAKTTDVEGFTNKVIDLLRDLQVNKEI